MDLARDVHLKATNAGDVSILETAAAGLRRKRKPSQRDRSDLEPAGSEAVLLHPALMPVPQSHSNPCPQLGLPCGPRHRRVASAASSGVWP